MPASKTNALLAGNVPFLVVLILCGAAFIFGKTFQPAQPHVAIVEKGAVILDAVLASPDKSRSELMQTVQTPILKLLQGYSDRGFVVIDVSKSADGSMSVVALPKDVLDLTPEIREAVRVASAKRSPQAPTHNGAATPAQGSQP